MLCTSTKLPVTSGLWAPTCCLWPRGPRKSTWFQVAAQTTEILITFNASVLTVLTFLWSVSYYFTFLSFW